MGIYSRPMYLCQYVSYSLIWVVWCEIVFTVGQMLYELQIGGEFSQWVIVASIVSVSGGPNTLNSHVTFTSHYL